MEQKASLSEQQSHAQSVSSSFCLSKKFVCGKVDSPVHLLQSNFISRAASKLGVLRTLRGQRQTEAFRIELDRVLHIPLQKQNICQSHGHPATPLAPSRRGPEHFLASLETNQLRIGNSFSETVSARCIAGRRKCRKITFPKRESNRLSM